MSALYYGYTILTGVLLSVMIVVNGSLGILTGLLLSSVLIHIVGLAGATGLIAAKREMPTRHARAPWWMYLGGAAGVGTVLLFNTAYGQISVTALVALGLLGQAVASLLVDHFGFMEMKKRPVARGQIPGILVALVGIFVLSGDFTGASILPVILALSTGLTVVLSRTINGALAKRCSPPMSAWYNHLVGLSVSLILFFAAGMPGGIPDSLFQPEQLWVLTGGLMGVAVVTASNFLVHHISSYSMTLLLFVGQIFSGVALDYLLQGTLSPTELLAGLLLAAGFGLNAWASGKK